MQDLPADQKPIVNCHAHIFTADHVPPYLAKTFVPWPFYYLLPLSVIVQLFRKWYKGPGRWYYQPLYKAVARLIYSIKEYVARHKILNLLKKLAGTFLTIEVFYILYGWLSGLIKPDSSKNANLIENIRDWLTGHYVLYLVKEWWWQLLLVLLLFVFFASGRNFILFIFRNLWKFMGALPGKKTQELFRRYLNIGRFAFHDTQAKIFEQLKGQYPPGTRFVILPMDMEYMDAGPVKEKYEKQMDDLAVLKRANEGIVLPFVFADPRRMAKDPNYFVYEIAADGTIRLKDCFVKTYIEEYGFAGFKIYPALGYYPFDAALLPLWRYAAQKGLPVLTHCIRGTIFYRGAKEEMWDTHPIFQQAKGDKEYEKLLLPEMKNIQFINNFTHPLNFLCLLDKSLLRKAVEIAGRHVQVVFGYSDENPELKYDLSDLKICFGHFGGDDEWNRYFEMDRYTYAAQLEKYPGRGINFTHHDGDGSYAPGKPEQIWKWVDWYSIICSMMLQYPNVYSDISFIVHNPAILPLLRKTLHPDSGRLRDRVLFGTDFYVVRNYKSDKNMLADMMAGLTEEEFNLIARENPERFLTNRLGHYTNLPTK